ncbi:MAG: ribosome maturation factor RimP [Burkholderiales bacterium]|nr:MAG: ribosome maturation factor RimP [Burkholderiales bacterium]
MTWQDTVAQTVSGLGFDLVDLERSAGGLLRVTIDWPWVQPGPDEEAVERFVTVEDCERVTRQLQYLLEVEGVDYRRLEVGSPGIDRPLRHESDFQRFQGEVVDITLKAAIGSTDSGVAANRKKFRGVLERAAQPGQWQVVWSDEPPAKPGQRVSKKRQAPALQALAFSLDEIQQARLAPIVNFKGRQSPAPRQVPAGAAKAGE